MTDKINHKMSELDRAGQYREFCEKQEQKARHRRNTFILLFVVFGLMVVASKGISGFFSEEDGKAVIAFIISFIGYIALIAGIGMLFWAVSAINKSIQAGNRTNKARKLEGTIAQNIYRLMITNSNH